MNRAHRSGRTAAQRGAGWLNAEAQKRAGLFAELPIQPSAWELLLRELAVREADAVRLVSEPGALGEKLRRFVEKSFKYRFVPMDVLHALSLADRLEREIGVCPDKLEAFLSRQKALQGVGAGRGI